MGETLPADKILTLPNAITVIRLAFLPLFVWLLLGADNRIAASILLGALGATDWVDGWAARKFNQVSTVGKVLDPVADRLLFFVAIVAIWIDGSAPRWFCAVVLLREIVISAITLILAALGARRIDVNWYGKAGTFGLMFTFPAFVLGAADWWGSGIFTAAGWILGIPSILLSYYAAVLYVPAARTALREGRHHQSS